MTIEQEVFSHAQINHDKLVAYGFTHRGNSYTISRTFMAKKFRADITITKSDDIIGTVYDTATGDEFLPMRVDNMADGFIGRVKDAYTSLLINIRNNIATTNDFVSPQTRRIVQMIADKYTIRPEFPWEKYPHFGTFKHDDNKKWFALIMQLERNKLGVKTPGDVEIINIKLERDEIQKMLSKPGFYPAYHMNKQTWITITLDDTCTDKTIMNLIGHSFNLTASHNKRYS